MYNKPTNSETSIIRDIFANSAKEVSAPQPTLLDEGWMEALMKAISQAGKSTAKGAEKAAKTVAKTPETIPGVKPGKMTKTDLPVLADRTAAKAVEPVRTGGMSTGMKTGAAVAAGTMAVGSAVAPFMVGGEQKTKQTPETPKPEVSTQQPVSKSSFSDVAKAHGYNIPNTSEPAKMPTNVPSGPISQDELTAMGLGNKPSVVDTAKNIMTKVARPQPAPQPVVKPAAPAKLPEQPMDRAVQNYKSTQPPAELPSTTTPAAKPAVSDEDLVKIVPGSQMWGGLSSEQQKKIASHYAAGKSSLSIRQKGGKFDEAGYGDQGQYGDIVKALNKVQMQESYYNRLATKLDEAMGIEQSAYGFNPKGGRKVQRLAKRYGEEPMASWSGDSATVEDLPKEPSQDMQGTDAEAFVKKHVMDLMSAAQEKGIEMTHGEAHKIATQRLKQHLGQAD